MRLRTVGQIHLVLESCCAVCILRKLGLTWVLRRPRTYHSTLAELSVVHQLCPMCRIFFFLSRLPTASNNSIALLRSSPSMDLWNMNSTCCLKAFHSPTRSALSQLNLGLLDAVSILLFIYVLIWLHMGSVHQDASGLKHIPLLTPCYIFMWANISNRNSHVGRCFIQQRSPLFLQ